MMTARMRLVSLLSAPSKVKAIKDEFSELPVSRQLKWRLRKTKQGKCEVCGKPGMTGKHCRRHAAMRAESTRQYWLRQKAKRLTVSEAGALVRVIDKYLSSVTPLPSEMRALRRARKKLAT